MKKQISDLQLDLLCFPLDKLRWLNHGRASRPLSQAAQPAAPKALARKNLLSARTSPRGTATELPSIKVHANEHSRKPVGSLSTFTLPTCSDNKLSRSESAPMRRVRLNKLDDADDVIAQIGLHRMIRNKTRPGQALQPLLLPGPPNAQAKLELPINQVNIISFAPGSARALRSARSEDGRTLDGGSNFVSLAELGGDKRTNTLLDAVDDTSNVVDRALIASTLPMESPRVDAHGSALDEDDSETRELFSRFTNGSMEMLNEIPQLVEILHMAGYPYSVNLRILTEVMAQERNSSFLDVDDFSRVFKAYKRRISERRQEEFDKASKDSGVVVAPQLPGIFGTLGLSPIPMAIEEAVKDIIGSIEGSLTFDDFQKIYGDLYSRAGLTRSVYQHASDVFDKHAVRIDELDEDEQVSMAGEAIITALIDLEEHSLISDPEGFLPENVHEALTHEVLAQIKGSRLTLDAQSWRASCRGKTAPTSVGHSFQGAVISRNAFLVMANALHQAIALAIREAMDRIGLQPPDSDMQPWLDENQILDLFDELGHVAISIRTLVQELLDECDLTGKTTISFDEFYSVLMAYCRAEGFSKTEKGHLVWLYDTFHHLPDVEVNRDGEISAVEIMRFLRWLCYTPSHSRILDFLERNGKDDETYMNLRSLMETVAEYRYANMGMVRNAFRIKEERPSDHKMRSVWRRVPFDELGRLMQMAGHRCSEDSLENLEKQANMSDGRISWREFLRLEGLYRGMIKPMLKDNLGFTDVECAELHHEFKELIPRKEKNSILYEGLEALVLRHIPNLKIDAKLRKLVQESDKNNNNKIEFEEFLWIMRRLLDKDSRESISKARKIRKMLGYSIEEVHGLRELFNVADKDRTGFLNFKEVRGFFSGLVAMTEQAERELRDYINELDTKNEEFLDFWDFLRLMKTLQSANWRNIIGVADNQASLRHDDHPEQQRRKALVPVIDDLDQHNDSSGEESYEDEYDDD